jgi:hypothetical protein
MPDAGRFPSMPLTSSDTYLISRPGYKTPAFKEFRAIMLGHTNIRETSDALA